MRENNDALSHLYSMKKFYTNRHHKFDILKYFDKQSTPSQALHDKFQNQIFPSTAQLPLPL
jgi:hypothetical protein